MRRFAKVIDLTECADDEIALLKTRLENGIDLLRKAQNNVDDQVVFMGVAQELADVVKDIGTALTGREIVFDERKTIGNTVPNVNGEYRANDLKCPKCRSRLSIDKPGSYDCLSCGSSLVVDALPRIGSKDDLSITHCIPSLP